MTSSRAKFLASGSSACSSSLSERRWRITRDAVQRMDTDAMRCCRACTRAVRVASAPAATALRPPNLSQSMVEPCLPQLADHLLGELGL